MVGPENGNVPLLYVVKMSFRRWVGGLKCHCIGKINNKLLNKLHELLPPGDLVSPSGGFASLAFDQAVPKNSQRHLGDRNAICILHGSDYVFLCCLLSQ